jgi:GntR family transcriptional regulator / MocR family aminotransferase
MEPMFELALSLPSRGSRQLLRALHSQLRAAIVDGRLKPGLRLPPTREMASIYRVSRNTVVAAYDLLLTEGYLSAQRGAGTFVAAALPRKRDVKRTPIAPGTDRRLSPFWRTAVPLVTHPPGPAPSLDFRMGTPDIKAFPFEIWRRLYGRALRTLAKAPPRREDPQGRERLRVAISRHVSFTRAVACAPEDIVVTSGAQQAFDFLARVLVTPTRTSVAIENPGYPPARFAFASAGARLVPVPVDAEGMVVSKLPRQARVVCVTPSHQFPLGCVLSTERRVALLERARRQGAVIIEDDYDGEFRFSGRPLDALQTLDRDECVFYVGTFSKSLFPAIRVGFIVAPSWARPALVAAKQGAEGPHSIVAQEALADFIGEGHLTRHVRKMRRIYAERRTTLLEGLAQIPWLEPVPSAAGLHVAAFTRAGLDADALEVRARERGIGIRSIRSFYIGKAGRGGLGFGLGPISQREIEMALPILRRLGSK